MWKYYQTSPQKCVTEVTYAPVTTKPGKLPTIGILGESTPVRTCPPGEERGVWAPMATKTVCGQFRLRDYFIGTAPCVR